MILEIIKIKYQKQFKNTEIAANGKWVVPIPQSAINTHKHFNDITVMNTSSSDIEFTPDHDDEKNFIVPAKGSMGWSFVDDNFKCSNLHATELSGNIVAANKVQVIVIKKRKEQVGGL